MADTITEDRLAEIERRRRVDALTQGARAIRDAAATFKNRVELYAEEGPVPGFGAVHDIRVSRQLIKEILEGLGE